MNELPQAQPRTVQTDTALAREGRASAVIVSPAMEPYASLAERLRDGIERFSGVRLECFTDTQLLPERYSRLPDAYRNRPLVLLGNINTNRALVPLYARYFCATDATYPGPGGYEVRSLVNPYGTRVNSVLLGGSAADGVERAVERFLAACEPRARNGELSMPFTLDVSLAPALAHQLAARPDTLLDAPKPEPGAALLNAVGAYTIAYAWSGDGRYACYARDCLRALNRHYTDGYGDWHYAIERIVRAIPWLSAGRFLDSADLLHTDELLLATALGTQHMWWRMSDGRPPLGHRHHGKGTMAFYLQARYLLDHAVLNEAGRQLCERWAAECRTFLDALARARVDDQDDESTLNNLSTLVWYALGEERFDLFESGNAWLMAQRAIGVHDNMGAGAGVEGYGEALLGAMANPQEAGLLVAAGAFYYRDGQLKWIRRHMPNLETPLRWDGWSLSPPFMHKFDTGDELASQPPERLTGLRVLPISPYQAELVHHPPRRVHNRGHFVDAPEVWQPQGGVGVTTLAQDRMFDKLVLRGGFERNAPYVLLQGYHGGFRWQGSMHSVNAIVRFSQFGHIFLIQNTDRQSYLHKNGLLSSDGYDNAPISPVGEWLAAADYSDLALSATRLNEYHHTAWTRHLFWLKKDHGTFLVIDAAQMQQAGPYSFTLSWRTPCHAEMLGQTWQSRQGGHIFRLRWNQDLSLSQESGSVNGAVNPYVLRQVQRGEYDAGAWITFHNLFCARPASEGTAPDITRLSPEQCLVTEAGRPLAWCAIDPRRQGLRATGMTAQALSALATPEEVALAGMRQFTSSDWKIDSDRPVGLCLDLAGQRGIIQADTPDSTGALVSIDLGGWRTNVLADAGAPFLFNLPAGGCDNLRAALADWLNALAALAQREPQVTTPTDAAVPPDVQWQFEGWQPVQERIRAVTVTANPLPLDGYADQLIDTVTPEIRTLSQQWPDAPRYDFQLELDEPQRLHSLRVIGDSRALPTLRVFHPLPDGIVASVSTDGFQSDNRACDQPIQRETHTHRRFYAFADPMEALRIPIHQQARQVRLQAPRPSADEPLVLHEIELYADRLCTPPVIKLVSADLDGDGDGERELVAINAAHEVVVLSHGGAVRWRWQAGSPITHMSCHDMDGAGRRQVCVCTLDRLVRLFEPDGRLRQTISLQGFQDEGRFSGLHMGTPQAVNSLAVWHREPDGRGALVLGCYGLLVFIDPDGQVLGHSFVDGAWVTDLLAVPTGGAFDLWTRTRWNHGHNLYTGQAGMAHSGAVISFGGARQQMFRACECVIPFVTGDSVAFEPVDHAGSGYVLSANENGFGVLSISARDWLWKIEGGAPLTACRTGHDDGEPVVVTGGADGFVCAFGLLDGQPRQRLDVGAPVRGVAAWEGESRWLVGTRERLIVLDKTWRVLDTRRVLIDQMCAVGPREMVMAQPDGRLLQIKACVSAR